MKRLIFILIPFVCYGQTFKGLQRTQGNTYTIKANELFESFPNSLSSNPIQNAIPDGWVAWFDPNQNITLNGSTVSQWCDISNTYCVTQGTAANQPTYVSNNNRPYLSFNGSTNVLSGSGAGLSFGTSSYINYILVGKYNSTAASNALINTQSPTNGTIWIGTGFTAVVGGYVQPTTARYVNTSFPAGGSYTTLNLYGVEVDRSNLSSSIVRTRNNGTYIANSTATFSDAGANYSGGTLNIGQGFDGYANIFIYDILIYRRQLTASEWNSLYNFFKAKYGLL